MQDRQTKPLWTALALLLIVTVLTNGHTQRVLLGLLPGEARAAMAVIDNSNLAQNAQTAAKTAEMLSTLNNVKSVLDIVQDTLGSPSNYSKGADLGGILTLGTGIDDVLGQTTGQSELAHSLEFLSDFADIVTTVQDGEINSINSARRLVRTILRVGDQVQGKAALRHEAMRGAWYMQSVEDAMGTAIYNRETAAQSIKRIRRLRKQVSQATDLQERLTLNNTIMLTLAEEIMQLRGLLATEVQMRSSRVYADQPIAYMPRQSTASGQTEGEGNGLFQ